MLALHRAVKEGLATTARQLYLKTPESLTRLASRMTISVEYRTLSQLQDNPPLWEGIDHRELERELQLELRQRFPARLPPGTGTGRTKRPAAASQPKGSQSARSAGDGRNIPANKTQTKPPTKAVPKHPQTSGCRQPWPG